MKKTKEKFLQIKKTNRLFHHQLNRFSWLKSLIVVISFFVVVGVAYAYFTSQDVSADLVFHTGSLKIELTDPSQLDFDGLKPGDEQVVEYSVKNIGSMPVYLKGKFTGGWQADDLNNSKLQPVKLEYRLEGGDWTELVADGPAVDTEYFYGTDDTESSLTTLLSDQVIDWRATFEFAGDVDDSYQNQEFKTQIRMAAKQVTEGAEWGEY